MRWAVASEVIWTRFDDSPQWIAYCVGSADVHLLNEGAHALWCTIAEHPGTTTERLLSPPFAAPQLDPAARTAILDTLSSMDRAGLVEPVSE